MNNFTTSQFYILLLLTIVACSNTPTKTRPVTFPIARDSMGHFQTQESIENEHRTSNIEFYRHPIKRVNTDDWQ